MTALLDARNDAELARLMTDLGGHCLASLTEAFDTIDHDRPTLFLAYTVKGCGTPLAGHKDNHAGLMNTTQMAGFQKDMGVEQGREWDKDAALKDPKATARFLKDIPFFAKGARRYHPPTVAVPATVALTEKVISTQAAFGKIIDEIARSGGPLADRIMTTAPDVTTSTNLGGWVNRRGLFARDEKVDTLGRLLMQNMGLSFTREKLIIRKCHKCGELNEGSEEPRKCSKCKKSFLPFNYFSKVHAPTSKEFDELFAKSDELQDSDIIKGIAALW